MMLSNADDGLGPPPPVAYDGIAASREADHRIANSLQLVSALLSSEGRGVRDPIARAALDVCVQRIGAIAGIHRQLYASPESGGVDLCAYLVDLVGRLQSSFSCDRRQRPIHLEADPSTASGDFASGVGIIVTELVINACKHAYLPDQEGDIEVIWEVDANEGFSLEVRDRGRGRVEREPDGGLGSRIVELMARKLDAEGRYVPRGTGTTFVMTGNLG